MNPHDQRRFAARIDKFIDGTGVAPLTVTIVAADGRSRSARIEVEAGRGLRMMSKCCRKSLSRQG